jgi:hypothetical protein
VVNKEKGALGICSSVGKQCVDLLNTSLGLVTTNQSPLYTARHELRLSHGNQSHSMYESSIHK